MVCRGKPFRVTLFLLTLTLSLAPGLRPVRAQAQQELQQPAAVPDKTITIEGRILNAQEREEESPTRDESRFGSWRRGGKPAPDGVRPRGTVPYIVRLKTTEMAPAREDILRLGGDIVSSDAAGATFLVRLDLLQATEVEKLPQVDWVRLFKPADKLSESLRALQNGEAPVVPAAAGETEEEPLYRPGTPLDVLVLLYPGQDPEGTEKTIRNRQGTVHFKVFIGDSWKLKATLHPSALQEISGLPDVRSIDLDLPLSVHNDQAGSIIGIPDLQVPLTGRGQIIGHADSGLDIGVNDGSLHSDFAGRILKAFPLGRKGDTGSLPDWSDPSGHGTHTAATIVGTGSASGRLYRGVAPDALLVHQSLEDGTGRLDVPTNLGALFQQAYDEGARIHSDSWGLKVKEVGHGGEYLPLARELDLWSWNDGKPHDMLIVCAAGNDGPEPMTVGAPATAKNCLTVGATGNGRRDGARDSVASFSSRGETLDRRIKPDLVAPGAWIVSARTQAAITRWRSDLEELGDWRIPEPFAWSDDAARSGRRSLRYHQPAGATFRSHLNLPLVDLPAGLPVYLEVSIRGNLSSSCQLGVRVQQLPSGAWKDLSQPLGQPFSHWTTKFFRLPASALGKRVRIALEIYADDPVPENVELHIDDIGVTTFRSWGAVSDLELATAGDPLDKLYTLDSGTSMAAPVVAGAAALVREYLERQDRISPTAELLKAILVNGADRLAPGPWPNRDQGWGRVNLSRSLPRGPRALLYQQDGAVAREGESSLFAFEVTDASQELRITLVWCDPPGSGLVHDLDLMVQAPDGTRHFPFGAAENSPDIKNNVEGMDLAHPLPGRWQVSVTASRMPQGPQPYAVVVSGAIRASDPSLFADFLIRRLP